ncbi:MAG: hypothetical protein WC829_04405 [Hyphomicrobium sp.]|jgi:cytochrome b561
MFPEPLGLLVAVVIIASLLVWMFRTAPFIQPPFRQWGEWGTIAVAAFILITRVVLPFLGVSF